MSTSRLLKEEGPTHEGRSLTRAGLCVSVCLYLSPWLSLSVCVCLSVSVCVCVSLFVYVCLSGFLRLSVSVCICLCLYVCVGLCMYACLSLPYVSVSLCFSLIPCIIIII